MEEPLPPTGTAPTPPAKKRNALKWLCIILALLLVAAIGLSAWLWMQAEADKKKLNDDKVALQAQIDQLKKQSANAGSKSTTPSPTPCNDTPTDAMKANIKAALDSKNTAVFSTYTTNPVKYVLAASEFGGDITPDEAATSLEYTHEAMGPWDFNLPAATITAYDSGFYTAYFDANTYVGRAADGMVVAFDFNCDGKISQIFVAANEDLL